MLSGSTFVDQASHVRRATVLSNRAACHLSRQHFDRALEDVQRSMEIIADHEGGADELANEVAGEKGADQAEKGVDHVEKGVVQTEEGVDHVEKGVDQVEKCVDQVEKGVNQAEKGIDHVEEGIDHVEKGVGQVEKGVDQAGEKVEKCVDRAKKGVDQAEVRVDATQRKREMLRSCKMTNHMRLGMIYKGLGRAQEARDEFAKALSSCASLAVKSHIEKQLRSM